MRSTDNQYRPCTTGVKLFLGSKVLCMFCFEICTPEGRGGEKGGSTNFKTKHTEPFTQEIPSALHCTPEGRGGEKGGSANYKTKHTEPFTQEITSAPYTKSQMI